jgi:hypothetical protein
MILLSASGVEEEHSILSPYPNNSVHEGLLRSVPNIRIGSSDEKDARSLTR